MIEELISYTYILNELNENFCVMYIFIDNKYTEYLSLISPHLF